MVANAPSEAKIEEQIYNLMAFWFSALLYGVYLSIFLRSFRPKEWKRPASRVFFVGKLVMFAITSFDTYAKGYTLVYAFGRESIGDGKIPLDLLENTARWDIYINYLTVVVIVWIADILVIYRCYIVWDKNWKVIVVPCILLSASISKNIVTLHWVFHPELTSLYGPVMVFFKICAPLNLAQNLLTTGLIVYKILRQHYVSVASGVTLSSGITLMDVIRIIVESAMLYTVQLLCIIVLYQIRPNTVIILRSALVTSASIIFVMLSTRIESVKARRDIAARPESLVLPTL